MNSKKDLTVLAYSLRASALILLGSYVHPYETQTCGGISTVWDELFLMEDVSLRQSLHSFLGACFH